MWCSEVCAVQRTGGLFSVVVYASGERHGNKFNVPGSRGSFRLGGVLCR